MNTDGTMIVLVHFLLLAQNKRTRINTPAETWKYKSFYTTTIKRTKIPIPSGTSRLSRNEAILIYGSQYTTEEIPKIASKEIMKYS